jgi:hypothetical protein
MTGAPERAQPAEVPLIQGKDCGGPVPVGEDHVRRVGDAEVIPIVTLPVDDG